MARAARVSWREACDEIPLGQCWAIQAWALESNPWGAAERKSPGYIAQQIARDEI